jgi:hypothetical protein
LLNGCDWIDYNPRPDDAAIADDLLKATEGVAAPIQRPNDMLPAEFVSKILLHRLL